MKQINIVVGSKCPVKVEAVKNALCRLGMYPEVISLEVSSGVNAQPEGNETYRGAHARAMNARMQIEGAYTIGIESGLFSMGTNTFFDKAVVMIVAPDCKVHYGTTSSLSLPTPDVYFARERGFATTTVAQVIARRLGGDPQDPHAILTKGKVTRQNVIAEAMHTLLAQVLL